MIPVIVIAIICFCIFKFWGKWIKHHLFNSVGGLDKLSNLFTILGIGFAGLFLVIQFFSGQFNSSMEVSLETNRYAISNTKDNVYVLVKLKRSDSGRITLDNLEIEATPAVAVNKEKVTNPEITQENITCKIHVWGINTNNPIGMSLPPSDATQLAYLIQVNHGEPILIDATICAPRTMQFWATPQWRASAISLPIPDVKEIK